MQIEINNIGQLRKFNFQTEHRINIIHAENGTGKTTFSRLLSSLNNAEIQDLMKTYCNAGNHATVRIGHRTNHFQDGL